MRHQSRCWCCISDLSVAYHVELSPQGNADQIAAVPTQHPMTCSGHAVNTLRGRPSNHRLSGVRLRAKQCFATACLTPASSAMLSDRHGWRKCRKCRSIFRPGHRRSGTGHRLPRSVAAVPLISVSLTIACKPSGSIAGIRFRTVPSQGWLGASLQGRTCGVSGT